MTEPVQAPGAEPPADAGRLAARAQALLGERLKRRAGGKGVGVERIPRVPRPDGRAPLSFAQERLWFLDRLQPGSPIYNLSFAARLRGPLELPLLAACFDEIVRRHEVLRTTVALEDGRPVQVVAPPAARPLRLIDLGGVEPARREAEARRLVAAGARRPFDLSAGPLLRTDVVRLAGDDHVLLLTQHHVVSDDWSVGVLLAELQALYRAYVSGRPSPLPELPIQYADYAEWQRSRLAGEVLEEQLAFWRRHLEGAPAVLELPADRPRPARQSFHGATRRFTLPDELSAAVRGLARREGATVFMTLLAAFEALLHRLTAQDDLVVGTPIANRGRLELEGLIGLFVNTLAMRTDLGATRSQPGISFHELVERVRKTALDAYTHQDLPFEKLVEELQPERDLSRSPIFQVLFQVLGAGGSLELPGLTVELVAGAEGQMVKFDLVLSMSDGGAGLSGIWRYRRDLFDDGTIARLHEQFQTLLAGAAAHPGQPLSELPLLTARERRQLRESNATERAYPEADLCLHQLIARQVERTPEAVAVGCEGRELTYRELAARARGLAFRLRALGVGPEVRVGICVERSLELVVGLLGILEAGGAYVPLDPAYPRERLAYLLEDARVAVLLTQERLLAQVGTTLSASHVLCLDGPEESLSSSTEAFSLPPPDPSSLAYVIYTSGSTGKPKGAMNSHRAIVNRLLWMQQRYGLTTADRVLQKTPFSFDVSVWELFWPLLVGARLVVARPGGHQDPAYLIETIAGEGITTLHFVPSMLQVFLDAPGVERCTSLRRVIASGEALPPELEQRFFSRLGTTGAGLYNLYGPTEAAVDVTHWDCTPGAGRWVVPIGHPVANTQIHLLGRYGEPVPVGVPGELFIAGLQVGRGYLGRPELTAERFLPDPFSSEPGARMYRTGDLARRRVDGAVEYLGRLDHQVKIRGFRIELGEIEAALAAHSEVREAVVLARDDAAGGKRLVAYVVPAAPFGVEAAAALSAALRSFLAGRLPEHMVPSAFVLLPSLPLSPNGKVDRKALPEPEAERERAAGEPVAPRTALERLLAELFQKVLRAETIGVDDDFFAIGGNSIRGAGLVNRLQERLGEIVHVVAIFDAPTVARLAAFLEEKYPSAVARWTGETARVAPGTKTATHVDAEQLARLRELVERGPRNVGAVVRPERRNRPALFVLSPPRSGSTLLRVMLAGNPRLFAPPELELLSFATLAERRAAFPGRDAFWREGLIRAVMAARGLDPESAGRLVEEHEREGWTTQRFYGRLQEWLGERLLVDKTPSYSFHPAILARAEEQFEGALYLHLTRHPGGTIRSFEEARIDQIFFPQHPFALRELAELTWLTSHLNILAFLETVPPERQLRVRFEELLRDPRGAMEAIAAFAGVPFDPAMLEPYAEGGTRMTDGLHRESRMLGDVKFHQHGGIDAAVAQRWRESVDEEALGGMTRDVSAVLGYDRDRGGAAVAIERTGWRPGTPLPLSFQQERLWVLDQLQPGLPTYNIPVALSVRGALDVAAFRAALAEIVRRHAVLRARFVERDGVPYQVVAAPALATAAPPVVDLSRLPAAAGQSEARRLVALAARRPFDLAAGPLLRTQLLRLGEAEHLFALTVHHVVCDGWSMAIFLRELLTLYGAFAGGRPSPLPELPIQYPDYAAWQRRWLSGEVLEAQVAHWRERLAGAPTALELPTDRPRPAVQGYRGAHLAAQLPAELRDALAARAGTAGVTLFMVLLAGLDVLLYRHSGQADLLVGSPIANRTRLATEGLIGFFVNTLLFRAELSGEPPVRELLARVRDGALAAYAHQELPFEKLVEALQPVRDLGRSPLFQVMFQFQNLSRELPRVGELQLSSLAAHSGTAKFDLTLTAAEAAGGLRLFLEYDRDLFDATTAERLLRHYRTVLEALAADASRPLSELPWLGAPERHQLLAEWNDTARVEGGMVSVPDLIAAQARRRPEAVAVAGGAERLTYAELERRAAALAARLRRLGAGSEVLVGIALERTPAMVAAVLGVLRSGAAYVPLDPAHPRERLALILEAARPLALVTQRSLLGALPAHAAEVVLVDGEEEVLAGELGPAGGAGDGVVLPEQTAYVLFTSGSTGRPKGVQVPHGALSSFLRSMQREPGFAEGEALLAVTTLSFDIAGLELLLPLIAGGRVELATRDEAADGELLQRRLAASGATVLQATPATWRLLLEAGWPGDRRLAALCGGEALPGALAGQLLGRVGALWNMYGPTETTIWSATRRVRAEEAGEATVPVGGAIADTRLYVVDRTLEPVALGVAGELAIGGAGLARGYLGAPELTAERFVPDPHAGEPGARMYRSGDLARRRADGRIDFLGRMDFQVKVRGFRIELGEIEAALSRHPAVAQGVVVARESAAPEQLEAGKRLVAYVVPRREPAAAAGLIEDLRKWLAGKLPDYMVPSAFVVLEALPLNPSGKVDRRALPDPAPLEAAAGYVAPRGLIEERLAGIWSELLRLDRVGAHDSFFALGGHSLLAARLVSRLRGAFAVEVPLRRIFEVPTLAALAAEVATLKTSGARAEAAIRRVPRDRPLPASFAQERLWFLDRLDPGSAAYTMAAAWSLSGRLLVLALGSALAAVVRRHEALRTVFAPAPKAGAVQRVLPFAPSRLPLVDLQAVPPAARAAAARALAVAHARRPFDLARGPLFRAALLRLGPEEHLLLFAVHHIVSDGWSQGVLVAELSELYAAALAGRPSPLAPLPIQYADYAAWQRRRLRGKALAAQLAFWRAALAGAPALLELPTDRPRPAVQTFAGARQHLVLPPPLPALLAALSRREGATLFMTLLAAFQVLLARWSGVEDLTVGTPIAGRTRRETEGLIGLFVNTLVLRADLAGDPGFSEFLDRVRERAFAAFAHQDLPFEKLVEALNPERALSHTPLFQVLFVLQNAPRQAAPLPGLRFGRMEVEEGVAKFDLTLVASETAAGLALNLEFNRDLFDATTARRFLRHLETLLAGIGEDPCRRLGDLPWLAPEERHQLLAAWNDTARDYGPPASLHALIARQVERTPDTIAVVFDDERLTYAELDRRAEQLSRRLRRFGVGQDRLVAVAAERSCELVVALLGILKAGGAYVPIDPSYPAERLAYMLEDSQAAADRPVLLTQQHLLERLPLAPLRARGGEVLLLDSFPWSDAESAGEAASPAVDPDHAAYMIYTSGSTGRPKGVVNTHRAIVNRLLWMQEAFALGPEDRVLQKTPFSFDVSVWEFFWPLLVGARLVVARPEGHQDARYLARLVRDEGVTTLHFVPSMLQVFLEEPEAARCRGLRRVVCSGEALAPELVRRFFERLPDGPELHNLYGPTEAAVDVSWWPCTPHDARRGVPIGRPIANLSLHVVDRGLQPVAVGVAGELVIGGVGLARGYHGRPELTAERFVPGPFGEPGSRLYRTGDLARLRADGAIEYLGRLDHQVKLRGFRIELGEIEAALAAHPAVREAVVVAREESGEKELVAYVVAETGAGELASTAALREHLRVRLPEYMVPPAFVFLPSLPLSPNGKVDRKALPAPRAVEAGPSQAAPRGEMEELVAAVWREVLGRDAVGVRENFFDLGGHSLKLVEVQRKLEARTGRELSIVDLFRHPTVAALAAHLAPPAAGPAAAPAAAPVPQPAASGAVAIVGMAGRFPGAASVAELWERLCAGEELIHRFSDEELLAAGVEPELLRDPLYVPARGVLAGSEQFDAGFFEYAPREAQLIDPQQRVFLECAWEALEDAGHAAPPADRRVGVFAGLGESGYAWNVHGHPELVRAVGAYQVSLGTRNDYLPTRVSYKLDLKGPSVNVQTACSTSLVAVHLACRALLAGECDVALAGGVFVAARQQRGYLWEEGHILSRDGRCRAFDAGAGGTVVGSGAGVVVLRRLADALADGDRIAAVILGSAINNDGAGKVGFTAPSVDGQAAVIAAAQRQAGVDPATIGYVEAHGTGTPLGDPIEVRALTQAFRAATGERGFCALGSVKTNLGHLDAAAGVTGLIKAALAVGEGRIPPSLHFERPNPELRLEESPFYVAARLQEWPRDGGPRRAGVSSFGIGGTNAHVVLEEAPAAASESASPSRPAQLLLLSAKSAAALEAATDRLADHLERHDDLDLADVAHTLRVGRRAFAHRRAVVCASREEAVAALRERDPESVLTHALPAAAPSGGRPVAFLFPGQGAQHAGMGAGLYREEPAYRAALDRCCDLFLPEIGVDLRDLLHAEDGAAAAANEALRRTELAQPALFAVEWALAALWGSWGVRPDALLGHSIGEYVAACLAGVFPLEEAVRLVAARGRLMGELPEGAMLGVALAEEQVRELLGERGEVAVAAVNTPGSCVLSGPAEAVEGLRRRLEEKGVETRPLHTSHAFHSPMMEPALPAFRALVETVALKPPAFPYLSNLTGTWITAEEATDPGYWVRHLRHTVRFADGLAALCAKGDGILLEVGPGRTLTTLATRHPARGGSVPVASLRPPRDPRPEGAALLAALGRLWLLGVAADWRGFQGDENRRRVPLPTYPFERRRYWVDAAPLRAATAAAPAPVAPAEEPAPAAGVEPESRGDLLAAYVPPRDDTERRIADLFGAVLGVERVGAQDDFFDLGGSSLLAVRLATRLREAFDVELSPHALLEAPTVAALARAIGPAAAPPPRHPLLVPLADGGAGAPLFLIHPAGGHVLLLRDLAAELAWERPVWGLRALGLEPGEEPLASVEEMAALYLEAVRTVRREGPYLLAGSSMGGMVAYEMAQRLRAAGEEVGLLALFDTYGPGQMPAPFAVAAAEGDRLAAVQRANTAAMFAYRPRHYPGRLVHFRAATRRPGEPSRPEQPWIELALGGAEVHVIPGDHRTMQEAPQVAVLAARLRRALLAP